MRLLRENSPLKIGWDLLVCVMAFITGLILPMELLKSFGYGHALTPLWSLFSLIGLLDIALTFNTSFERNGIIIKDRRLIARRYLRGLVLARSARQPAFFGDEWDASSSTAGDHAAPIALAPAMADYGPMGRHPAS